MSGRVVGVPEGDICTECGNDLATEGMELCVDCAESLYRQQVTAELDRIVG